MLGKRQMLIDQFRQRYPDIDQSISAQEDRSWSRRIFTKPRGGAAFVNSAIYTHLLTEGAGGLNRLKRGSIATVQGSARQMDIRPCTFVDITQTCARERCPNYADLLKRLVGRIGMDAKS
jgi:hypothetical protein